MYYKIGRCFGLLLFLVVITISNSSCIYEDLSQCYKEITLSYIFKVDVGGTTEEQFKEDAKDLRVFIFDEDGIYVGVWYYNINDLNIEQKIPLNLPLGIYTMVMWGGITPTQYSVGTLVNNVVYPLEVGKSKIEDFKLKVICNEGDRTIDEKYENLYYSISRNVEVKEKVNVKIDLPIQKVSNDIVVKLHGLPRQDVISYSSYSHIEVCLKANNGVYNYDNSISNNSEIINYLPFRRIENEDVIEVELRTLDVFSILSPRLIVRNSISGIEMYNYNLRGLIQQIPDPQKEKKYMVELFYNTHGSITLKVNGWVVIPQEVVF